MTHDQIMLVRLRNEVKAEISLVDKLVEEYRNLPTEIDDSYKNRIKASIFHDFYTGTERVFKRIEEELNGGIPRSDSWIGYRLWLNPEYGRNLLLNISNDFTPSLFSSGR